MELLIYCLLFVLLFSAYSKNKWAVWPVAVILVLFVGFRDVTVGTDTANYSLYFQILKNGGAIGSEYLFGLLNKLVIFFDGEYIWSQVFSAVLAVIPIFMVVYRKSPFPYLSIYLFITLYIYFYSFNIVRQSIAVAICFIAVSMFFRRKLWYFALIVVAVNFHASAIVMAPLFFIDRLKLNGTQIVILLFFTFVIGIFLPSYILSIAGIFGYSQYLTGTYAIGSLIGNMFYLLLLNSIFFVIYKFERDKNSQLFYLFLLFLLVTNLLIRFPFGNRVILYLSVFQILYFPDLISRLGGKDRSLISILVLVYSLFSFYIFYGNGEIFPYKSILDDN